MLETLNPQYADNKRQARTIQSLEEKQKATEQQISEMKSQTAEILSILRALNGDGGSSRHV